MQETDQTHSAGQVQLGRLALLWAPNVLWMIVIFGFSQQAHSGAVTEKYLGDHNVQVRKLAHVTEYAVLCLLNLRALRLSITQRSSQNFFSDPKRTAVAALLLSIFYACTDEWHQSFIPGRSATVSDVGVDSLGCLAGLVVGLLFSKFSKQKVPIRN